MSSLRNQLQSCQSRMCEIHDEIEGVGSVAETEARDITEAEAKMIDDLRAEFETLEGREKTLKKAVEAYDRVKKEKALPTLLDQIDGSSPDVAGGSRLPAMVRSQKSKYFASTADCYAAGRWLFGMLGHDQSRQWAIANGLPYRNDQSVGTPGAGGYTVPTPLAATIIRLVEEYGVFRQFARNIEMSAMTLDVPKRTDGLTVYYPGEGNAITPSDITVEQINLVAKKYALLNIMSTELVEDAIINWTDQVAQEMAWAISLAEDTNGFLGDGSAGSAGITGIESALAAGSKVTAAATGWAGVALNDLEEMAGLPPAYAGFRGRWYMNRYTYFTVVTALLNTAGGTDMRQIEAGGEMMLLGYPVTFTQVLPGKAGTTGDMGIVFGDLSLGAMMGVRRALTIRILSELYAASDQIGLVCTSRSDCVIHDEGTETLPGSIVALILG